MSLSPQQLHQKNMNFFANHFKAIHDQLTLLKHNEYELLFDAATGDADVKYRGKSIYSGSGKKQAEADYQSFLKACGSGKPFQSVAPVRPDTFALPRTAHRFIANFLGKHVKDDTLLNNVWPTPSFYPQLVVVGIGLGFHLTTLLRNHKIHNLVLFESDFTMILMSTFVTDWEELYKIQNKAGHSITLLTGRVENGREIILSTLASRAPHFPVCTHFFIHNAKLEYLEVAKAVNGTRHLVIPSWGQYDDEINQTNHIVQNLQKGIRLIPSRNDFKLSKPVLVVGAGPSLDRHIESIKRLRHHYLIFSSGSAISALIENDIFPDLHVELESDYLTYKKLVESKHADAIRKIPLCAAIQCSPYLFEMFEQHVAFVKDSLYSGAVLTPNMSDRVVHSTPTCTNTAVAIAAHFNAPEVRLVGVDLGYYELEEHHSKSSMYYEDSNIGKTLNSAMEKINRGESNSLFTREGYNGKVRTYWVFDLAKESLERLMAGTRGTLFINHSDGAVIKGCLRDIELDGPRKDSSSVAQSSFLESFLSIGSFVDNTYKSKLHKAVMSIQKELKTTVENALASNSKDDPQEYVSRTSNIINTFLLQVDRRSDKVSTVISGTVRQYMLMGMTTVLMIPGKQEKRSFQIDWAKNFPKLLKVIEYESDAIYRQTKNSLAKERLELTIMDPLPEK